jgi:hypothetical protein
MTREQLEILNRVKLLMEYDMKNTSSENFEKIIKEGDEKWSSTYSCVPKHPNAKKVTLSDGSTAYTIWGVTYYNSGRRATSKNTNTNYSCNDIMFKYPTNQAESDKFRNWMFKNYDAKSLKSSYDLDPKGPWNSVAVLKAWSLNGTTYLDKKGNVDPKNFVAGATFDEKCGNKPNMVYDNYYKKCILSEKRYYEIIPGSKWGDNEYDFPYLPVQNESDVYALYALWFFMAVNDMTYMGWYNKAEGRCAAMTKDAFTPKEFKGVNFLKQFSERKKPMVCYNNQMAGLNPSNSFGTIINKKDIGSKDGRLEKFSLTNYNGFVPSYADIGKTFGTTDLSALIKKLRETRSTWINSYSGQEEDFIKNVKPSADAIGTIKSWDTHDYLMFAQIATFFIPVVGPWISMGLNVADAGLFLSEGEEEMAALTLGLGLLFDVPGIAQQLAGKGVSKLTNDEIRNVSRHLLENNASALTQKEATTLNYLLDLNKSDPQIVRSELEKIAKEKSSQLVNSPKTAETLTPKEMSALKQYADGTEKIGGLTSPVTKGGLITGVGAAMSVVGAVGMGFDIYKQASKTLQYNIENLPQVIDKYYGKEGAYKNVFTLFGVPEEYKKDLTGNEGTASKSAETYEMQTMLEFKEKGYSIDYVSLAKAWTEGWRPVDVETMEVNPIPFSYVTTMSSLMTDEEKKKRDDEALEKIWSDVKKEDEKPRDENDKTHKKAQGVRNKYDLGPIKRELPRDTTGMNIDDDLGDDY